MSSQPDDLAEILAAIARQEEAEEATRLFLQREAEEEATRKFLAQEAREKKEQEEADAKLARDVARQSEASNSSSSSSSSSSTAQGLALLKTSTHEAHLSCQSEEVKVKSDEQTAHELQRHFEDELLGHEKDRDYAVALQTHFQLEKSRSPSLQYDIKENSEDAFLAAALQGMEDEGATSLSEEMLEIYKQLPKRWEGKSSDERKKIEENLKAILVSPAVAGEQGTTDLTNAHKFTSTLIRAGIPVLTNIDDQFKLSSIELTPDKVQKEVLEFLEKLKKEGIDSRISIENIQKTFGHVQSNPAVEASETQANAHHLLSRTWTLAKTMGRDGMTVVVTLLSDNIGDGGSCIPGLIARLYSPYAKMLAIHLGVEVSAARVTAKPVTK